MERRWAIKDLGRTEKLAQLLRQFPQGWPGPLIMGVLNLTPDSFHDGGRYLQPEAAEAQLNRLAAEGADLADLGAMSSRPGHQQLSATAEMERLLPLLRRLDSPPLPLSIDTDKPQVAEVALAHGVSVINDCSGRLQPEIYALAARYQAPLIVVHRQGEAGRHEDMCGEVIGFFQSCRDFALAAGVGEWQLIFDPGLGFNKNRRENLALMAGLPRLTALSRPLLLGYSHKRFLATLSGEQPGNAPLATDAATVYAALQGVHLLRVHEAGRCRALVNTALSLRKGAAADD